MRTMRARFQFGRSSCAHALAWACLWLLRAAVRQNDLSHRCSGFAARRHAPTRVCFGGLVVLSGVRGEESTPAPSARNTKK